MNEKMKEQMKRLWTLCSKNERICFPSILALYSRCDRADPNFPIFRRVNIVIRYVKPYQNVFFFFLRSKIMCLLRCPYFEVLIFSSPTTKNGFYSFNKKSVIISASLVEKKRYLKGLKIQAINIRIILLY